MEKVAECIAAEAKASMERQRKAKVGMIGSPYARGVTALIA